MTKEELIRMAREAGVTLTHFLVNHDTDWTLHPAFERFAALVVAAERNRTWTQEHWTEYERSIAAAEREACAKLVVDLDGGLEWIAKEIRARSNT